MTSGCSRLLAALLLVATLASTAADLRHHLRRSLLATPDAQCSWAGGACLPSDAAILALGVPTDESEM
jgi:hypothetical protein